MTNHFKDLLNTEIEILSKVHHARILNMHEHFFDGNFLILIIDFCDGGTLEDYLIDHKQQYPNGLPEELCLKYLKEMAEGFYAMYQHKIIH